MKTTKLMSLALAFVAIFTAACGSSSNSNDPNSPSGVSKRFVEAAQKKDVQTFKSLLSRKSLAGIDKDAKEAGLPTDKMIATLLEQDLFPKGAGDIETRNEKISGDKATVEIKGSNGKWSENDLIKEDGSWKVSLE